MAEVAAPAGVSGSVFKMLGFYFLASQMLKQGKPSSPSSVTSVKGPNAGGVTAAPKHFTNAWKRQQAFDLRVYTSDSEAFDVLDEAALVWHESDLTYVQDDHSAHQAKAHTCNARAPHHPPFPTLHAHAHEPPRPRACHRSEI